MSTDLAVITPEAPAPAAPTAMAPRGVAFRNLGEVERFAELIYNSTLVPSQYRGKKGDVIGVILFGQELGLHAMASLQNIAWINGKPSVYGDLAHAMVVSSGLLEDFSETDPEQAQREGKAVCTLKRRGRPPITRTYTKEMAVTAKLWNKEGPWSQHPGRMLQVRARGWAERDEFSDVLKGLYTVEEAQDIVLTADASGTYRAAETPAGIPTQPPTGAPAAEPDEAQQTLIRAISELVTGAHPGNSPEAKTARSQLLMELFHVPTRSRLTSLSVEALQDGYRALQGLLDVLDTSGEAEQPMDDDMPLGDEAEAHLAGLAQERAEAPAAAPAAGPAAAIPPQEPPRLMLPDGQWWELTNPTAPVPWHDAEGEVTGLWMAVLGERAKHYGTEAALRELRQKYPAFSPAQFADAWGVLGRQTAQEGA
jgi:hypothetical protein